MVDKIRKGAQPHYYIKEHMKALGLTDQKVADRMSCARGTVNRYKHQQWKLKPPVLVGLSEAIFGHQDYLEFTKLPEPKPEKHPPAAPSTPLEGLTADEQRMFVELARKLAKKAS